MDTVIFSVIVGAGVMILLGILWAWTIHSTTHLKIQSDVTQEKIKTDSKKHIESMKLETKKLQIQSQENISTAQLSVESKKNNLDYDIEGKKLIIHEKEIDNRFLECQTKEIGSTNRLKLECDTKKELNSQNIGFEKEKLAISKDMFDSGMLFQNNTLQFEKVRHGLDLGLKKFQIESQSTTAKYLADNQLEAQNVIEKNANLREKMITEAKLEMSKNILEFKKKESEMSFETEIRRIEGNVDIAQHLKELGMTKEKEKTQRKLIDGQSNIFTSTMNCISNVASVAGATCNPMSTLSRNMNLLNSGLSSLGQQNSSLGPQNSLLGQQNSCLGQQSPILGSNLPILQGLTTNPNQLTIKYGSLRNRQTCIQPCMLEKPESSGVTITEIE